MSRDEYSSFYPVKKKATTGSLVAEIKKAGKFARKGLPKGGGIGKGKVVGAKKKR
jgi:hypothetical protein